MCVGVPRNAAFGRNVLSRPEDARAHALTGRSFVHPAFDYLLIGGGLSLVVTVVVLSSTKGAELFDPSALAYLLLLSNSAHFASSTVRLYTKPGARASMPFLTMGFPLVALAILALCIHQAGRLGPHLQALYLTWSPYHYAAQAYGIGIIYAYRSGCRLAPADKKLLWWVSLLPFLYSFLSGRRIGLNWLVPTDLLATAPVAAFLAGSQLTLVGLSFVAPLFLFLKIRRSANAPLPIISLLVIVANGVWWLVLNERDAFVWATVFHGIQYLAIVLVFHVKDQMSRPANRHGRLYHTLWFYGVSLALGYGLFHCLPLAYVFAGFGAVESMLLVAAAINIHHFIVDAYIWRLKGTDHNRRVVDA